MFGVGEVEESKSKEWKIRAGSARRHAVIWAFVHHYLGISIRIPSASTYCQCSFIFDILNSSLFHYFIHGYILAALSYTTGAPT